MTFLPSLDKPWSLLVLAWFFLITWVSIHYYTIMWIFAKWIFFWFTMIMCIPQYHSLILLNQIQATASLKSTYMHEHLDETSGQGEELGVRPHHPWLRWPPIFIHISLILYESWPRRCSICFLHGRGPSSYLNHPKPLPLFTPSFKHFSLPPHNTQALSPAWPAMLSPCTWGLAPPTS